MRGATLSFSPATLTVGGVEVPLGGTEYVPLPVKAERDVSLPPRTVMSCGGKVDGTDGLEGRVFQIDPTEKYTDNEEGVTERGRGSGMRDSPSTGGKHHEYKRDHREGRKVSLHPPSEAGGEGTGSTG